MAITLEEFTAKMHKADEEFCLKMEEQNKRFFKISLITLHFLQK